jgi:type II secretory pathway pseudopilin PulG
MDHSLRQRLLGVALAGALFLPLTSCDKPGTGEASSNPSPAAPGPAAESAAPAAARMAVTAGTPEAAGFNEVAAQLDPGGFSYLYFRTESFLSRLSAQLDKIREIALSGGSAPDQESVKKGFDLAKRLLEASGLEEISGVGSSGLSTGVNGIRNKVFIQHAPGHDKGVLWAFVGPARHPLETEDLLPARTALAFFNDINPPLLANLIGDAVKSSGEASAQESYNKMMASISSATGMPADQALKTLVGPAGLIMTLDPAHEVQYPLPTGAISFPAPGLAIVLHATDDHMFTQLETMIMANPSSTKVDEPGLRIRSMAEMPMTPQFKVTPSVARWGEYIILASDVQLVRDIVGAKGKGVATTEEFKKLADGLPTTGNGFYYASSAFSTTMGKLQAQIFANNDALPPQQKALFMSIFKQQAGASGLTISARLDNGWLMASNQIWSSGTPDLAGLFFSAMAASAMPAFETAREKAKTTQAESNARQVGIACLSYASDHNGKFPATLQELVPDFLPEQATLKSPFNATEAIGYEYTPGLTTSSPADATLLSDRFSEESIHERVVVHVDGSVQSTKVP